MTSRELIAVKAEDRDRAILYREGLFRKTYERPAHSKKQNIKTF